MKIINLCIIYVIVVCLGTVYAFASDSQGEKAKSGVTSVSEEIKKELGLSDNDVVFKLYNCPVVYAFGKADSIEGVLDGEDILQIVYAVQKEDADVGNWHYYMEEKGTLVESFDSTIGNVSKELQFLLDNDEVKKRAGDIKNEYLFFNPTMNQGTVIYYETDGGDFIYYSIPQSGEYLFPKNVFFDYMKEVYAKMGSDIPPGGIDISTVRDISKYNVLHINEADDGDDVYSNSADESDDSISKKRNVLVISLCAGIVIAGLIIVFGIKRHQKKKKI